MCIEYQGNGLVCPIDLKNNVFTTAPIGNLYHNPSSATAKSSFHGTTIGSTICFYIYVDYHFSLLLFRVDANNSGRRKQWKLPVPYTDAQPTVS